MDDTTLAVLGVVAGLLACLALADRRARRRVVQLATFTAVVTAFALAPITERASDWVFRQISPRDRD